jgi:D-aspartate ligase
MDKLKKEIQMNQNFIPLLFAGDINVYSVARAFHEQYDIKSKAFGKYQSGPCIDSRILDYTANPKLEEQDTFLQGSCLPLTTSAWPRWPMSNSR